MEQAGLRDGMTISFHHHLRNGDYVLNMVLDEAAKMGVKDLTVNASSVFDCYEPMLDHIRNGVVTGLETDYIAPGIGRELSKGILPKTIIFRTHGSRPADILSGRSLIDIAFIAAPASDSMGNCSGKYGPSACGSLGYAFADAMKAKKVVVITDHGGGFFSMQTCPFAKNCGSWGILFVVGQEAAGYTDARTEQAGAERAAGTE